MFSGPRWSQSARTISEKDRERDRDRDWDRHRNSKRPEPSGPRRQSTTLPVREKARGTRDEPRRKSTGRSQSPPAVRRPSKEDWGKRSGQQHSKAPPRRSSSAERWPAQDVRTVVVTLRDLSYRRKDIVLHLAPTDTLGPAEELLRRRFAEPGRATERIRDGEHIAFYFRGEEIVHDAALGESDETTAKKWRIIFYRVSEDRANADQWPNSDSDSESESDDGSDVREQEYGTHGGELRITHLRRGRHVDATGELRRCVLEAINAGKTIGELRTAVAIALGVPDPYRIVLVARGGMRPGALQGNEWQAQHMKSWLPDRLAIEVCPRRCYLILRGLGREYVYQPPFPETPKTHVAIPDIQRWMERRLLTAVHQYAESEVVVRPSRIELSFRGKPLGPKAKNVSWGDIVHFDLPDGVAEVFEREETWLLAPTETCAVCGEDKRVTEMPRRITARCEHLPTTCKDCLAQWIDSSMDTVTWDQLRCPECPRHLKYQDVQAFASRKTFEKYDAFAFRAALGKMPNFFFCLDERCGSGHIHDKGCARFVCSDCGSKACINHEIPWHRGETCEQYDKRNEKRREDEKKSKKFIKKTSKRCPRCKRDVFKYAGCNHITCRCGHHWCYVCLGPYPEHYEGCSEDPFGEFRVGRLHPNVFRAFGVPPPPDRVAANGNDDHFNDFGFGWRRRHGMNDANNNNNGAANGPGMAGGNNNNNAVPPRAPPPPAFFNFGPQPNRGGVNNNNRLDADDLLDWLGGDAPPPPVFEEPNNRGPAPAAALGMAAVAGMAMFAARRARERREREERARERARERSMERREREERARERVREQSRERSRQRRRSLDRGGAGEGDRRRNRSRDRDRSRAGVRRRNTISGEARPHRW